MNFLETQSENMSVRRRERADVHPLSDRNTSALLTLFSQLRACEALKWQAQLPQLWAFPPPDS